ncbi:hypothetical protein DFJ74DRAFT_240182 [Hyaloraphidium curvatum]|nr:hypothetical protein DFJ74DRAFT_240182 [Hyaloraphidium curvatum]
MTRAAARAVLARDWLPFDSRSRFRCARMGRKLKLALHSAYGIAVAECLRHGTGWVWDGVLAAPHMANEHDQSGTSGPPHQRTDRTTPRPSDAVARRVHRGAHRIPADPHTAACRVLRAAMACPERADPDARVQKRLRPRGPAGPRCAGGAIRTARDPRDCAPDVRCRAARAARAGEPPRAAPLIPGGRAPAAPAAARAAPSGPHSPHRTARSRAAWRLLAAAAAVCALAAPAAADLPPPAFVDTRTDWPHYETDTFTYRNISWKVPRQQTSFAWFGGLAQVGAVNNP